MNRLLLLFLIAAGLYSCGGNAEKPTEPASADSTSSNADTDTTAHLPIADLLRDDIRKVETYAGGILRKGNSGSKKDSTFVQLDEFQRRADQFILKELDSAHFQQHFRQTSLMDETSRLLNFIYTPKDSVSPLRKVIVYVAPSLASDNVDRIYMETAISQGDTIVEKRLTWKVRKYFYVLTIKQPKTGDPITTMEKLIWDPQHFGDK
jgi:hypothetical protein